MNSVTLVDPDPNAEPLDETVYPRRRSRARPPPAIPSAKAIPEATAAPVAKQTVVESLASTEPAALNIKSEELDATIPPRKREASAPARGDLLLYLLLFALIACGLADQRAQAVQVQRRHRLLDRRGRRLDDAGAVHLPAAQVRALHAGPGQREVVVLVPPVPRHRRALADPGAFAASASARSTPAWRCTAWCIVVASGVVGRFIYVRIHRGLNGERTSLARVARARRAGRETTHARACTSAPRSSSACWRSSSMNCARRRAGPTHLRQVTVLPLQQWITYLRCVRELRKPLHQLAGAHDWSAADLRAAQAPRAPAGRPVSRTPWCASRSTPPTSACSRCGTWRTCPSSTCWSSARSCT